MYHTELSDLIRDNEIHYGGSWYFTNDNPTAQQIQEMESNQAGLPQVIWKPQYLPDLSSIGCPVIWHSLPRIPPVVQQEPLENILVSHHDFICDLMKEIKTTYTSKQYRDVFKIIKSFRSKYDNNPHGLSGGELVLLETTVQSYQQYPFGIVVKCSKRDYQNNIKIYRVDKNMNRVFGSTGYISHYEIKEVINQDNDRFVQYISSENASISISAENGSSSSISAENDSISSVSTNSSTTKISALNDIKNFARKEYLQIMYCLMGKARGNMTFPKYNNTHNAFYHSERMSIQVKAAFGHEALCQMAKKVRSKGNYIYYDEVDYTKLSTSVGMDEITKNVDGNTFTICSINMKWNKLNIMLGISYWLYYTDPLGKPHTKAP